MSLRKITDGPWNVGTPDDNGHIGIIQPHPSNPGGRTGYIVAKVTYATETADNVDHEPTDESKAVANLVAAAPDMRKALHAVQRLFAEALPKFNWAASALDADAIQLLNETPGIVAAALAKADAPLKFTRDNPRCPESETGWSQNAKCVRRCTKHKGHEGRHTFGNWSLA